jgi:hypothetical protein
VTPADLTAALANSIDAKLAEQLVEEATSLEEAFILRKWKYTELDGGRFAEVAARIVYSLDSGNLSLTKGVDDCLKYIDNVQVPHHFPEPQAAIHLAKVVRAIYKLRSQRGAVHVSPTYTANEIDSRLIVEAARWVLADILRIFVSSNREEVADIIRSLARFPQPLIRQYGDLPLLQSVSFTTEEEVLAHLLNKDDGLTIGELIASIPKDQSSVRRAVKKMAEPQMRQTVLRAGRWIITDLGSKRIEARISREFSAVGQP